MHFGMETYRLLRCLLSTPPANEMATMIRLTSGTERGAFLLRLAIDSYQGTSILIQTKNSNFTNPIPRSIESRFIDLNTRKQGRWIF